MDHLGEKIKAAVKMQNDNRFVEGFVTTSLIICVGAMAIVGAMEDGLSGDSSMLIAKSLLDFVIVAVLTAHRASLKEYHKAQTRAINCAKTFY